MISLADSQPLKTNLFSPNLLPRAFSLALGPRNEVVFHQQPGFYRKIFQWQSPCQSDDWRLCCVTAPVSVDSQVYRTKLVYINGNNAAEGENNIKYADSYPMNLTVKNWFAQDKFESLW